MTKQIGHYIGGKVVVPEGARKLPVYDPGLGEVAGEVHLGDAALLDSAVKVATEAYQSWERAPLSQRARVMFAYRELLERNIGKIAKLISEEHGKTVADAAGEARRGLEVDKGQRPGSRGGAVSGPEIGGGQK